MKIEVHLHTNDNCNLSCIHCYNKSGEEAVCNIPKSDSLLKLIQYFCMEYEAEIHLEGGEIFLRPELLSKMNNLSTEILSCITITTNGTICIDKPEIMDMLCRIHALRISVEGHTDEQQRMIRGITLEKVIEHALFYKRRGIPVCLRLTMTHLNCAHLLDETLPYYINMGFRNFQVYEFQAVGRGELHKELLAMKENDFTSFMEKLETWNGSFAGKEFCLRFMFSAIRREPVSSHREQLAFNGYEVSDIPAGNGVSIHADGSVYLCAWDNDESHCILNVYKEGIKHMANKLQQLDLKHSCDHCSAVCIALPTPCVDATKY